MKRLSLLITTIGLGLAAQAQTPPGFVNFDIIQGIGSSSPKYLTPYNNKLYFFAEEINTGRELFTVDATNAPKLVTNLNAGNKNALSSSYNSPMAGIGTRVYFTADNGASGEELYQYDGTNLPTIARDIVLGADSSSPDNFVVLNNILYYRASTPNEGYELHSYDPSSTVETRLTDIATGKDSSIFSDIVVFNNNIYFPADDKTNGMELWTYNLLTQQASMVADIYTGAGNSSEPKNLTVINGKLYFSATEASYGRELYEYDGTNPPQRVTDIASNFLSGVPTSPGVAFIGFNSKIYFAGRDNNYEIHLHEYDPATQTSKLAYKINPSGNSDPRYFAVYKNRLFFTANDGANGIELWVYDGTNTPSLMADICPGPNSSMPEALTVVGDDLYFVANDCNNTGVELMKYNQDLVGIPNTLFDGGLDVYPNPVQKDLHLNLTLKRNERLRVRVADMTGRSFYDTDTIEYPKGRTKLEVPMRDMPAGAYIYYITNENGTTYLTGKVIKQ